MTHVANSIAAIGDKEVRFPDRFHKRNVAELLRHILVGGLGLLGACGGGAGDVTKPPPVAAIASIVVSPDTATLLVGGALQLAAQARDASGSTLAARTITWSSENPTIAAVSASGLVTAVAVGGPVRLNAISGSSTGSATVIVRKPPSVTLLVRRSSGITGTFGDTSIVADSGTSVAYAFQVSTGYSALRVSIDDTLAAVSGQILLVRNRVLLASATRDLPNTPAVGALAVQFRTMSTSTDFAQAVQAAVGTISALGGSPGDRSRIVYAAGIQALGNGPATEQELSLMRSRAGTVIPLIAAPGANALGARVAQAQQPLQALALSPMLSRAGIVTPLMAGAGSTGLGARIALSQHIPKAIYVNGVFNKEADFAWTLASLEAILRPTGLPLDGYYNPTWTSNPDYPVVECLLRVSAGLSTLFALPSLRDLALQCTKVFDLATAYRQMGNVTTGLQGDGIQLSKDLGRRIRSEVDAGFAPLLLGHSQGTLIISEALDYLYGQTPFEFKVPLARCLASIALAAPVGPIAIGAERRSGIVLAGVTTFDIILGLGRNNFAQKRSTATDAYDQEVARWLPYRGLYDLAVLLSGFDLHTMSYGYLGAPESVDWIRSQLVTDAEALRSTCTDIATVAPANPIVAAGGAIRMSGSRFSPTGTPVPTATFTWTSSHPAIARVDPAIPGRIIGVANGVARITATSGDASIQIDFTVLPAPPVNLPIPTGPGGSVAPGPFISGLTPTFSWTAANGATGYGLVIQDLTINQFVFPSGTGTTLVPLTGTVFALPAGVLENNRAYRWSMSSFNGPTESTTRSGSLFFQTGTPPASPPNAPTNLTGVTGFASATLTWTDNSTNEDGFRIERAPGGAATFTQIASTGPGVATYTDQGLTGGLSYVYRVRAYNTVGNSGYTNSTTVQIPVTGGPTIALSPQSVPFAATANGANPATQSVGILNGGVGTLTGLSVSAVTYGNGQPTGWLTRTLQGTTAPVTLSLAAITGSLSVGAYTASLTVLSTAPGVTNSPQTVNITFAVTSPLSAPTIALSANSKTFSATAGGSSPAAQTIQITNGGTGTLSGLNTSVSYQNGQPAGWIVAALDNSNAPATLSLTPILGALPAGTYNASVVITSTAVGVTNSPQFVTVTLTVSAGLVVVAATGPGEGSFWVPLALSGQRLIFATFPFGGNTGSSKTLKQVPSTGGAIVTIATNVGTISQLTTDDTYAYWIGDDGAGSGQKIFRVPVAGGTTTTIASGLSGASSTSRYSCFLNDGVAIYFTSKISSTQYAMRKIPVSGGAITDLATVSQTFADGCALDSGLLYYLNGQTVRRVPTGGGASALVASNVSGLVGGRELLVVGSTLMVLDAQALRTVPIDGGAATTRASGLSGAQDLASDGTFVFLNDINAGKMYRYRISDFARITMITPDQSNGLVLDATSVYWIGAGGNKLFRTAK